MSSISWRKNRPNGATPFEYEKAITIICKTFPVVLQDALTLDQEEARAFGEALSENYRSATPFRHIALENFLPPGVAEEINDQFPIEICSTILYATMGVSTP